MEHAHNNIHMPIGKMFHIAIGFFLLFSGYFFSSPEFFVTPTDKLISMDFPQVAEKIAISLTPSGMIVLGVFLGTVYLWTFVDTIWPSFLGVLLLGSSPYLDMNKVLTSFMGSPIVVLVFFLFVFAAALVRSNVATYIARWLMTRPFLEHKPWLLILMLFFTTYCVAFFEQTTVVFLMWPVAYTIFKEAGCQKGDTLVSFVIVGIPVMALLSFATDVIKGGAFYLLASLSTYTQIAGVSIVAMNPVIYLFFAFTLSLIIMLLIVAIMRFVYKVDIKALNRFDVEALKANPLPPLNNKQKWTIFLFALYAIILILAATLPQDTAVGVFLRTKQSSASLFIVLVLAVLNFEGKSMLDFPKIMSSYSWTVFFLIASAFTFGDALTNPSTNFILVAESLLKEIFIDSSYFQLAVGIVLLAIFVTNFTVSVVIGLIFAPVIITLCVSCNFDYLPVLACFYYIVLIAICTPAASPFAALLYSNQAWVSTKDIVHYTSLMSIIVIGVMVSIGIPLSMYLF